MGSSGVVGGGGDAVFHRLRLTNEIVHDLLGRRGSDSGVRSSGCLSRRQGRGCGCNVTVMVSFSQWYGNRFVLTASSNSTTAVPLNRPPVPLLCAFSVAPPDPHHPDIHCSFLFYRPFSSWMALALAFGLDIRLCLQSVIYRMARVVIRATTYGKVAVGPLDSCGATIKHNRRDGGYMGGKRQTTWGRRVIGQRRYGRIRGYNRLTGTGGTLEGKGRRGKVMGRCSEICP